MGGLQKHGVKNKFEFLTFFETRQSGTKSRVFYHHSPIGSEKGKDKEEQDLPKNIQEHMYIDVPHPGKMLAVRGGYTRMHPCQECDGNESHESQTPPPPTKGC